MKIFPSEAQRVWERSSTVTLYSLAPGPPITHAGEPIQKIEILHGFKVLGKVALRAPKQLRQVRMALESSYAPRPGSWMQRNCFEPRHAIRAQSGSRTLDVIICFHCQSSHLYLNNARVKDWSSFVYSDEAAKLFNQMLAE